MNTPGFGIPVIANYGNGGSTNGALPAIDHTIYVGGPLNFNAPSLTGGNRLPLIERLTPRNVNATRAIENARSHTLVTISTNGRMLANTLVAGGRAIALRVRTFQVR